MTIILPENHQIRPCSVCSFFVYTTESGESRCNLGKSGKTGIDKQRWELSEISDIIHWPCMYNLTPEEIEFSVDSWVRELVNDSLRYRTSVQMRRSITSNRHTRGRKF